MKITIPTGAAFPWHTHPGPVLATVAEGDDEGADLDERCGIDIER